MGSGDDSSPLQTLCAGITAWILEMGLHLDPKTVVFGRFAHVSFRLGAVPFRAYFRPSAFVISAATF